MPRRNGVCRTCGYDVRGLRVCPECGKDPRRGADIPTWRVIVFSYGVVVLTGGAPFPLIQAGVEHHQGSDRAAIQWAGAGAVAAAFLLLYVCLGRWVLRRPPPTFWALFGVCWLPALLGGAKLLL